MTDASVSLDGDGEPGRIDRRFWDGRRWRGHEAFDTVGHEHISCYFPAEGYDACDIMLVECSDGRWYVEDNWGGDAKGADGVWDPFVESGEMPRFFETREGAARHAVAVVASVSGVDPAEASRMYLDSPD
jgi:hypothetical protein